MDRLFFPLTLCLIASSADREVKGIFFHLFAQTEGKFTFNAKQVVLIAPVETISVLSSFRDRLVPEQELFHGWTSTNVSYVLQTHFFRHKHCFLNNHNCSSISHSVSVLAACIFTHVLVFNYDYDNHFEYTHLHYSSDTKKQTFQIAQFSSHYLKNTVSSQEVIIKACFI